MLENLTLRIQKSTQQQGRSGSDEGWDGSGQICNIRKNCFSDKNFHRFVQTKWTLIRYSKMDREGWFPKFVIMRNIIKSDMRKVTILLWSLSQDFSKIREMTTTSCLCQIYIQTILNLSTTMLAALFKFYFKFQASRNNTKSTFYGLYTFKAESPGKKQDINLKLWKSFEQGSKNIFLLATTAWKKFEGGSILFQIQISFENLARQPPIIDLFPISFKSSSL